MRREGFQIYLDIINTIGNGTHKPTLICYRTNLSWGPMKERLNRLMDKGFIEERTEHNRKRYHLTAKGFALLSWWRRGQHFLSKFES